MLAKLGKLEKVRKLKYLDYQGLIKKTVKKELSNTTTTGILQYVLLSGEAFNWNGAEPNKDQPMLFIDEKYQSLVQSIKQDKEKKFTLEEYSYGTCKMVQIGTEVQVYLCPEKGKLTQPNLLKPIKTILKKAKPKLFLEVVADLETVEVSVLESIGNPEDNAQKIGQSLIKYHQVFQQVDKQVKALPKEDENRNKVLVQRSKILKHIKHLCNNWAEDIAPKAAELELKDNWIKVYTHWATFFEKRKEAKAGTSQDKTARAAEEERIYTKALRDLERFADDIKGGLKTDPIIIDNDISALNMHLKEWQNFVKKERSAFPNKLQEIENQISDIEIQWKQEREKVKAYHNTVQKLEVAIKNNATKEDIEKLYQQAEKFNHI